MFHSSSSHCNTFWQVPTLLLGDSRDGSKRIKRLNPCLNRSALLWNVATSTQGSAEHLRPILQMRPEASGKVNWGFKGKGVTWADHWKQQMGFCRVCECPAQVSVAHKQTSNTNSWVGDSSELRWENWYQPEAATSPHLPLHTHPEGFWCSPKVPFHVVLS